MKRIPFLFAATVCGALGTCTLPAADQSNWPHWRGPRDNGSTETGVYPVKWDSNTNLLWKVALPGKGCSTPAVWNQRIFVTAPVEKQNAVLAYDWSGKLIWQTTFGPERPGKHQNGSGCNSSPTTDGTSVFVYFKSGTFAALDMDGHQLWTNNLVEQYGQDTLWWDYGTSPVLTEKAVVMTAMNDSGKSYVAAFDKSTGKALWKVDRNFTTASEGDHAYCTPLVVHQKDKELILVWGGEHLTAHDATTGATIWTCGNFNPKGVKNWPAVASPVLVGDMAVISYARGDQLHGVKLGGSGDVTATHRVWDRQAVGSFVPTPAEYKGLIYILRDRGEIECIDPVTGKNVWHDALPKDSPNYYASPTIAAGKLYAIREDGLVSIAQIEGQFKLLGQIDMGERMIASAVPVANRLILRGEKTLFCIGEK